MNHILQELEKKGFRARSVSIIHIAELKEKIEELHRQNAFSEDFFRERLTDFRFGFSESMPEARSLIVAAFPQPRIRITFTLRSGPISLIVPPTYQYDPNVTAERLLKNILRRTGHRLARTNLPLKLLAVRSGLGVYGRNNICYIPGMGSFHRLMAFCTDHPLNKDSWGKAILMDTCSRCYACLRSCPTGAITKDDFMLKAHLCLTYLNEKSGDFPAWVNPAWHNALVGCLHCQECCPENLECRNWSELGDVFSKKETLTLLRGIRPKKIPSPLHQRLERLGLLDYIEILPRNIQAVAAATSAENHFSEKPS
ncbi:MAG: epoxyqueuosine reductase [Thermoplasmata archaeon]|nr:epoxyqueuosine reductase [Thermoplasmata archaeon]